MELVRWEKKWNSVENVCKPLPNNKNKWNSEKMNIHDDESRKKQSHQANTTTTNRWERVFFYINLYICVYFGFILRCRYASIVVEEYFASALSTTTKCAPIGNSELTFTLPSTNKIYMHENWWWYIKKNVYVFFMWWNEIRYLNLTIIVNWLQFRSNYFQQNASLDFEFYI